MKSHFRIWFSLFMLLCFTTSTSLGLVNVQNDHPSPEYSKNKQHSQVTSNDTGSDFGHHFNDLIDDSNFNVEKDVEDRNEVSFLDIVAVHIGSADLSTQESKTGSQAGSRSSGLVPLNILYCVFRI